MEDSEHYHDLRTPILGPVLCAAVAIVVVWATVVALVGT